MNDKRASKHKERAVVDEYEDEDYNQIQIESKGKFLNKKKAAMKRPKTSSKSNQPSKTMLKKFKQTQYLGDALNNLADDEVYEEERHSNKRVSRKRPWSSVSRPDSSNRIEQMELKEQRRQANLIASNQIMDRRRQKLMQKIFEDNLKAQQIKLLKQRSPGLTSEGRKRKSQLGVLNEVKREEVINYHKLSEAYKVQEIEAKRHEKNQFANITLQRINQLKQQKALENEIKWRQKQEQINNLKDVEEFKRGVAMAEISLENERKMRDEERKEQQEIAKAIDKRRHDIQDYFQQAKVARDRENNSLAEHMRNEENLAQLAELVKIHQQNLKKGHKSTKKTKKRPKRISSKAAAESMGTDEQFLEQIEDYKNQNIQEINRIMQEQEEALKQLSEMEAEGGEYSKEQILEQAETVKQTAQEMIEKIIKTQDKNIKKAVKARSKLMNS